MFLKTNFLSILVTLVVLQQVIWECTALTQAPLQRIRPTTPRSPVIEPYCGCQQYDLRPFAFRLKDNSVVVVTFRAGGFPNTPTVEVSKEGVRTYSYFPEVTYLFLDDPYLTTRRPPIIIDDTEYFKSRPRGPGNL